MTGYTQISDTTAGPVSVYYDLLRPRAPAHRPTVMMVHGGGHTGHCYLATADGRPGWAPYFAARGYPVAVPDWPGLGRSGWIAADKLDGEAVCAGLGGLIDALAGPLVLMTHSMSGAFGWRLMETHGSKLAAVVGVAPAPPGNIQPVPQVLSRGDGFVEIQALAMRRRIDLNAPNWGGEDFVRTKLIGASKRFPEARIPAYTASLQALPPRLVFERQNVDGSQIRVRDTSRLGDHKVLMVTGEFDLDHPRDVDGAIAAWLAEAGTEVTFRFLADEGMGGNGHMLMLEDNSDGIADLIVDWLDANIC